MWIKLIFRSLPLIVLLFLICILADELKDWDRNLHYVGDNSLVDSGVGWFPLIWLVFVLCPFMIASALCASFGRPARRYWAVVLGSFVALTAVEFYLDGRALHQICQSCPYPVPGL